MSENEPGGVDGPSTTVDIERAESLEALANGITDTVVRQAQAGQILRSASHAYDPDAEPGERWSVLLVFSDLVRSDLELA